MTRITNRIAVAALAAAASVAMGRSALAAVVVDGNLDADYGSALATQTINTGFGDSTVGDGTSAGGSELDAGYGVVQGGNLYLFLSGNSEDNGNHVNVFVSDGRPGQSTLAVPATGTMQQMNSSQFSPGFQATYAIDLNDFSGTAYVEQYNLVANTGGFVGSFPMNNGVPNLPGGDPIVYSFNDSNAAGVNGNGGTAANQAAADAVTTGLEIGIPLSLLGNPSGPISVLADINGGGDDFLSNQFLPGLPVGYGNLGNNGQFNFSGTPGQFFTVPNPEPATIGMLGAAGLLGLGRRRRNA